MGKALGIQPFTGRQAEMTRSNNCDKEHRVFNLIKKMGEWRRNQALIALCLVRDLNVSRDSRSLLSPYQASSCLAQDTLANNAATTADPCKVHATRVVSCLSRFTPRKQGSLSLLIRVGAGVFLKGRN